MGLVGRARRIAQTARYVADAGSEGGEIRLVPGDAAVTARLRRILRVTETSSPPSGALAVFSVAPGRDGGAVAEQMAERARGGERSVAVIIGRSAQRASAERALMETGDIEMSSIAHVAALDELGEKEVIDGVIRAVGSRGLVAAARRNPALREQASRRVLRRDARASGILASGVLGTQAHMANLTNRQVRMLGDLAAIRDRNLGREDAVDIVAVAGSGFAWRLVGRNAARASGHPMVARSVVAWAATRGMGMVAERRLTSGPSSGRTLDLDKLKDSAGALVGRLKSLREGRKS